MAKSQNQKIKILYLERMMRETGENRVITMQEILAELLKYGICAERKSIYDDFESLRSFGVDVRFRRGRNGGYYLAGNTVSEEKMSEGMDKTPEMQEVREETEKDTFSAASDEQRMMKLLFVREKEESIKKHFGMLGNLKEKSDGMLTCQVTYYDSPEFFGWLAAQGTDVKILKPKKLAQSYREYLKVITRFYKV